MPQPNSNTRTSSAPLDMGIDGNTSYLVYELVEGANLGDRIVARKRLSEGEAGADHHADRTGPSLRSPPPGDSPRREARQHPRAARRPRAKLTDFGLAKDYNNDQDLTRHASGLGTPNFMAPEQFADAKSVGPRADVYALVRPSTPR